MLELFEDTLFVQYIVIIYQRTLKPSYMQCGYRGLEKFQKMSFYLSPASLAYYTPATIE